MACEIRRILQLQEAMQYKVIKVLDMSKNDISNTCMYSWSTDMVCWTSWVNMDMYNNICEKLETDFYLRILLFGSFGELQLDGYVTKCYNIAIDSSSTFLQDFCGNSNLFQPYNNLDCAIQLQQQMTDSVICMLGIPVYYIRINPEKESADYTFKEYSLHKIDSIKQIKLIVPDGEMPSSNPKLTDLDFDWEIDWETEVGKNQFAKAFGDNAYPKQGDMVYIPMMNRMWEVNSAYDEKNEGIMWRSSTWKLFLVKYVDGTHVDLGNYDDLIDNWVQNTYENVFEVVEKNEQERLVGATPLTSPRFAATNLFDIFMEDSVRKQYTKQDISILDKTYNHKSSVLSRNIYKFKNENGCVTYQKPICGDSGTLMFIIETGGTLLGSISRDIMNFGNIQITLDYLPESQSFNINFDKLSYKLEAFKSYLVVLKWNKSNFIIEMNIYEYTYDKKVPVYILKPHMYYFDYENPICALTGPYNNDFDMKNELPCQVHSYPVNITNIKYYNRYLSQEEGIKESIKYTTQHEACVINDLARPIDSGHGYAVK